MIMIRYVFAGCVTAVLASGCGGPGREQPQDRVAITELVRKIESSVGRIEVQAGDLARATALTYTDADRIIATVDTSRYAAAAGGVYYKAVDDGGPAMWVSGVVPVDESIKRIAWATEAIDDDLKRITQENPAVVQVYYNDRNSLNRIYPPFDVLSQYEPKMNIPEFNFYYLADEKHNPGRKVVWVDEPYVDPAGRGWMVSCIAPVYDEEVLAGVVGLDVTVAGIVENFLQPENRAWALVDRKGAIVAATERAIELLQMPPLTDHRYVNTVRSDRYRSEDYNMLQSPSADVRALADEVLNQRLTTSRLKGPDGTRLVLAESIPSLEWTAMLVIE
jgi:hypothetical protein